MRVVVTISALAVAGVAAILVHRALSRHEQATRKAALERMIADAHAESSSMRLVPSDTPTSPPEPLRRATGAVLSPEDEAAHRAWRERLRNEATPIYEETRRRRNDAR